MNFLKVLSIFVFLAIGQSIFSQDTKQHFIDKACDSCFAKNDYTNLGENTCLQEALGKWDKRLNVVYSRLNKLLKTEQKQALLSSQRQWLKYRDEEFKFINAQVKDLEGSMYPNMVLDAEITVVKNRVLILEKYLSFFESMK
jgi:uncharacterized protein YecT (DUF1311 family)